MTFKWPSIGAGKNVVFNSKTACVSEIVSNTAKVLLQATNSNSYSFQLLPRTFDDLEWHSKVISAYVVIPTSNVSEIICDTTT